MKKEIQKFIKLTKKNLKYNKYCGGWCIRCALAEAMGKFGNYKDRISNHEAFMQVIYGNIIATSKVDFIVEKTREYLIEKSGDEKMVFATKEKALRFLNFYEKK